jgi:hypothetical protein
MRAMTNTYKILVGTPEGKRPLGRYGGRWEDIIRMDLREIGFEGVDWMNVAEGRGQWQTLVDMVMNFRVP